ncbi:hypothetical protein LIER_41516 [Lithospermum erythrorhizon]|uniref:Aminotransferase-like plant mobile domain-containing protein n=1 Tax=Lithospermum erythrorhizon TaxID=34254 RepID=A0AAV3RC57_LITER
MSLITAYVERWQPETNSFHMPFGEMTITLHDVYEFMNIPVGGRVVKASWELDPILLDLIGDDGFKYNTVLFDRLYISPQ